MQGRVTLQPSTATTGHAEEFMKQEVTMKIVEGTKHGRGGRPSTYTAEIAHEICMRLAGGEGLVAICRDRHMPAARTVVEWFLDDHEGFSRKYARARRCQAELLVDEIIEIAD